MDLSPNTHQNQHLLSPQLFFSFNFIPEIYVYWNQTPDSHFYPVELRGVRKEEIRVDLEDSKFLIIRTESIEGSTELPAKRFYRKFRLPDRIETNGISAAYEDGVLTVIVPKANFRRRGFFIDPNDALSASKSSPGPLKLSLILIDLSMDLICWGLLFSY